MTSTPSDLARTQAERDAARAGSAAARRRDRGGVVRRVVVGVFVFLFALLLPITLTATWAHQTVLNTNAWVRTVKPIASDPAVTAAVSREVTNQLYAALDPQSVVTEALPPKAAFLAGPITNGAKTYIQQAVDTVLQSDQFQQMWIRANEAAHAKLVAVLRGDTKVLQVTNGVVVLNLVPLVNQALQRVQGFASSVVGKPVTLPTVTSDEVPSAACQKIATALDRPLPPTCGQIALFPAGKLVNAQRAVRAFDRGVLALLIITPLIAVAALITSRRRRRTLLQLAIGGMLGLVVVRRSTMWLQDQLIATGRPENKAARTAIVHDVLNRFFAITEWVLIGGLIVVLVALVTGPYGWAVKTRARVADASRSLGHLVAVSGSGIAGRVTDDPDVTWVRAHFDLLRGGGVVVAVLLLLLFSVNGWGFLVIAAALVLYELWLYRLRPPATVTLPPSATA